MPPTAAAAALAEAAPLALLRVLALRCSRFTVRCSAILAPPVLLIVATDPLIVMVRLVTFGASPAENAPFVQLKFSYQMNAASIIAKTGLGKRKKKPVFSTPQDVMQRCIDHLASPSIPATTASRSVTVCPCSRTVRVTSA